MSNLESDAEDIRWTPQSGAEVDHEFCLFARSGLSQSLIEAAAERDDFRLFSIEDIVAGF